MSHQCLFINYSFLEGIRAAFKNIAKSVLKGDPVAMAKWKEMYPRGYEVQKELTRILAFAHRKDKELSKVVAEISKGHGHRDMTSKPKWYSVPHLTGHFPFFHSH